MGHFQKNLDAGRRFGAQLRKEQVAHKNRVLSFHLGNPGPVDARVAELASKIPNMAALKAKLLMQPDPGMRLASFAMIYPHLNFEVTAADLKGVVKIPKPDSADALEITYVEN